MRGTLLGGSIGLCVGVLLSRSAGGGIGASMARDSRARRRLSSPERPYSSDCAASRDAAAALACEALLAESAVLVQEGADYVDQDRLRKSRSGEYAPGEGLAGLTRWRTNLEASFLRRCEQRGGSAAECAGQLSRSESNAINFGAFEIPAVDRKVTVEEVVLGNEYVFENLGLFSATRWLGVSFQQDPSDAFVIADLLWRLQPDLVIELGTSGGGSAAFFAGVMREYNPAAKFLTMDPANGKNTGKPLVEWNRQHVNVACGVDCVHAARSRVWRETEIIRYVRAVPTSPEALAVAEAFAAKATTVMVIEDSTHKLDVVTGNVRAYARFVTPGSYLVVQDTRLGPPLRAAAKFLQSEAGACFERDRRPEYFMITQHWGGYLHRKVDCDEKAELAKRPHAGFYCQTDGVKCHAVSKKCFRAAVCDGRPDGFLLP